MIASKLPKTDALKRSIVDVPTLLLTFESKPVKEGTAKDQPALLLTPTPRSVNEKKQT